MKLKDIQEALQVLAILLRALLLAGAKEDRTSDCFVEVLCLRTSSLRRLLFSDRILLLMDQSVNGPHKHDAEDLELEEMVADRRYQRSTMTKRRGTTRCVPPNDSMKCTFGS